MNKPGQSHGTLEASVIATSTVARVPLSFLTRIPASNAAPAFFAVLSRVAVVGCRDGGGGIIVSRLDRVDDVNVFVENGRVAELLVAVMALGLGVILLQVHSQRLGEGEGLGAEINERRKW